MTRTLSLGNMPDPCSIPHNFYVLDAPPSQCTTMGTTMGTTMPIVQELFLPFPVLLPQRVCVKLSTYPVPILPFLALFHRRVRPDPLSFLSFSSSVTWADMASTSYLEINKNNNSITTHLYAKRAVESTLVISDSPAIETERMTAV